MNDSRWLRAKQLFLEAADLAPEERRAFIAERCQGDPALLAEALALLDADAEAQDFLEASPVRGLSDEGKRPTWVGRRFGPYQAIRELGRGGMGVVLLGERADGRYQGRVAIKVVQTILLPEGMEERFRKEGQILAALDHPNIARLLDAGDADDGLSFLVMEYIDGPRIDAFADRELLDIPDRLRLFQQVLEGVDYAHARGVVHRDLKPSNILVTPAGVPKLVDFGIAKLWTAPGPLGVTVPLTRTGLRMLTPEYASPEQVRGLAVDATTDIYSAGVVLYRLLTGRPPYWVDTTRPAEAERVVADRTPPRPSDAMTRTGGPSAEETDPDLLARNRSSSLDRLRKTLRGDLDTIVLKALAKEPRERYRTAGAFADDLARYLDGRPIRARPVGPLARAFKLVRRRRGRFAAIGLLATALGLSGWQAHVAREQRARAATNSAQLTELASSILGTINLGAQEQAGATQTQEAAVQAALQSLNDLVGRIEGEPSPELLYQLARGYSEVGLVQGYPFGTNLGKHQEALASLGRAVEILNDLVRRTPDYYNAWTARAIQRNNMADVQLFLGQVDSAAVLYGRSLAELEELGEERPDDPVRLDALAVSYQRHATLALNRLDLETSAHYLNLARETELAFAGVTPDNQVSAAVDVATLDGNLAQLMGSLGRTEEGLRYADRGLALIDSIGTEHSAARIPIAKGVLLRERTGRLLELGRTREAVAAARESEAVLQDRTRSDPSDVMAPTQLAITRSALSYALWLADEPTAAERAAREAIEFFGDIDDAQLPTFGIAASATHRFLAEALMERGAWAEAESELDRSEALAGRVGPILAAFGNPDLGEKERLSGDFSRARLALLLGRCEDYRVATDSVEVRLARLEGSGRITAGEDSALDRYRARMPVERCPALVS